MTLPRPLPGVPLDNLIQSLRDAAREAGNVHGGAAGRHWTEVQQRYLRWTQDTETSLALQVRPSDLAALLHTPRYWAILTLADGSLPLIFFEADERKREFEAAAATLQAERNRWEWRDVIVVPDTNVYLHNPTPFQELDWRGVADTTAEPTVVVPLVVIDELDRLKRTGRAGKDDPRTKARHTLRTLNELFSGSRPDQSVLLRAAPGSVRLDLLMDGLDHVRLPSKDAEIVDRAVYLQDVSGRPVLLISDDTGMQLRARTAGLKALPSIIEGEEEPPAGMG